MTSQKRVATRLPAKNKSKIWSRAMADECSFCAERRSTAIVRDDVILAHTDCKEMDLCPIRAFFRRKAFLFWQICLKVKFALSSYFYWTKKSSRHASVQTSGILRALRNSGSVTTWPILELMTQRSNWGYFSVRNGPQLVISGFLWRPKTTSRTGLLEFSKASHLAWG